MSEPMTRLFIADPDVEMLARLRPALAASGMALVGSAPSAEAAALEIIAQHVDAAVVDDAACAGTPAEMVRRIVSAAPDICVLVTAAAGTPPSLMGRAVAAGARGFLLKPYAPADLIALVGEAVGTTKARTVASTTRGRGRLVSAYAPKGGAGATTVAVNLAVALAAMGSHRVALVDLDLQFGDVGVLLNLSGANSIAELLGQATLSDDLVNDTFLLHPSGVRVLLAPEDLSVVESIEPGDVTHALEQLRGYFDIVVCDLWSMYEHLTREVLRMSDHIVLVTTPELPALRDLRRVLVAGGDDVRIAERSIVVLNRGSGKVGFSAAEVSKVLGHAPSFAIPSDGVSITEAINRGIPLLDARVRSKATRAFRDLAAYIAAPPARPSGAQVGTAKATA